MGYVAAGAAGILAVMFTVRLTMTYLAGRRLKRAQDEADAQYVRDRLRRMNCNIGDKSYRNS